MTLPRLLLCLFILGTVMFPVTAMASGSNGCGNDCVAFMTHGGETPATCPDGSACPSHQSGCAVHCMPAVQASAETRLTTLAATINASDMPDPFPDAPTEQPLRPPIVA